MKKIIGKARQTRRRQKEILAITLCNSRAAQRNFDKLHQQTVLRSNDPYRVIEILSNWQRSQWARAGRPGLRARDPAQIAPFTQRTK